MQVQQGAAQRLFATQRQQSLGHVRPVCARRLAVLRAADDNRRPEPQPVSLYLPFGASLPPDGQLMHAHEESCNIEVTSCKTRMYVYETKCECCYGTGFARAGGSGARARAGRGGRSPSLHRCLVCTGVGYVRRGTARYDPELAAQESSFYKSVMTLARTQKLPGEPEHQEAAAPAGAPSDASRTSRLQRAKELFESFAAKAKQATASEGAQTNGAGKASNGATATAAAGAVDTPQNNIVSVAKGRTGAQVSPAEQQKV